MDVTIDQPDVTLEAFIGSGINHKLTLIIRRVGKQLSTMQNMWCINYCL